MKQPPRTLATRTVGTGQLGTVELTLADHGAGLRIGIRAGFVTVLLDPDSFFRAAGELASLWVAEQVRAHHEAAGAVPLPFATHATCDECEASIVLGPDDQADTHECALHGPMRHEVQP